jgi:excisionase family DNA binding protein
MTQKHVGTVEEAAEVLQISRNSAYEAVKEGQIPSIRVGRRILVLWGPFMRKVGAEEGRTT